MNKEMNPIFTDHVLDQLSQLPEGTLIEINKNDIKVFKDGRDYEDYSPIIHQFFKTTLWVDGRD